MPSRLGGGGEPPGSEKGGNFECALIGDHIRGDRDRGGGYNYERGRRGYDDDRYGYQGRGERRCDPRDSRSSNHPAEQTRGYYQDSKMDFDRQYRRKDDYNRDVRYDSRRDRSRSRDRGDSSPHHDTGKNSKATEEERKLMEEVLRREREKSAAKGKAYASRPASFKESLGVPLEGSHRQHDTNLEKESDRRSHSAAGKAKTERDKEKDSKVVAVPVVKKTAADLAAIEEKKRKLMARYG